MSESKLKEAKLQKYFLVAGEIVIQPKDSEMPTAVRTNCVVMNADGQFPTSQLGAIQQTLQMQLASKLGEEMANIQIVDVVIMNIMFLGNFTPEQFNRPPEGMKKQEVVLTPAQPN